MPAATSTIETPTRAGASGPPRHRGEARLRLDQEIVGFARRVGAGLAVARNRAHNQPRMLASQPLDRKAELGDGARLEVLNEYVGFRQHGREDRLVGRLGEIEDDRFLAAVEPDKVRALAARDLVVVAGQVALRPL